MFRRINSFKSSIVVPFVAAFGRRHYKKKSWKMQRKKENSLENFHAFYSNQFGEDWPSIFEALKLPIQHCAVVNKFAALEDVRQKLSSTEAQLHNLCLFYSNSKGAKNQFQLDCYFPNSENHMRFAKQDKTNNGYFDYYLLDASSILPVLALDLHPHSTVLDMCAAPGGKSVLISQFLSNQGALVSSEVSNTRRANLVKVIKDYIPKISKTKELVQVRNLSGFKFGEYEPATYDRVLVDAPCSSERHNLQTHFEFSMWSDVSARANANLQKKLLMSAVQTVIPGGTVVYSTCSMSSIENDGVIDDVLSLCSGGKQIKVNVVDSHFANHPLAKMFNYVETKHGILVLPSCTRNWGPMYFCKLQRFSVESDSDLQSKRFVV